MPSHLVSGLLPRLNPSQAGGRKSCLLVPALPLTGILSGYFSLMRAASAFLLSAGSRREGEYAICAYTHSNLGGSARAQVLQLLLMMLGTSS